VGFGNKMDCARSDENEFPLHGFIRSPPANTRRVRTHLAPALGGSSRSVLHLDADFDTGWSAHAPSCHGVFQIGIGGEGVNFLDR
jgi:hypothetical protein